MSMKRYLKKTKSLYLIENENKNINLLNLILMQKKLFFWNIFYKNKKKNISHCYMMKKSLM